MRYPVIKTAFVGTILALFVLAGGPVVRAQSCTENTASVSETFSDGTNLDLTASSAKFWYNDASNPRGIMTMNKVGANFMISNPTYVPAWVNALTANDFDLDGWPDYIGTSSSYSNVLAFVKNMGSAGTVGTFKITQWIDGSAGDASGWPTKGVGGAAIDGEGHNGITSGDYDGDGDFDFLCIVSTTAGANAIKRIWLYENRLIVNGVNTGVLSFVRTDLTSAWSSTLKGIAWTATSMVSIDLDGDLDIDLVVGNREGNVFKITNTDNGSVNAQTFILEESPIIETGWGPLGVNTISIAEFDETPGLDIITGSASTADLHYYQGDGQGHYELTAEFTDTDGGIHDNMYDGAATVSLVADFDRDGDQDLIVGTDNWNYPSSGSGYGGKCYYFKNDGTGNFVVTLIFDGPTKSPAVADFDIGAVLDFDNDGDLDFFIADGNDSEYYYIFVNSLADVFNLSGIGLSTNLTPALLGAQYAITRARLTGIDQTVIGSSSTGLKAAYYLSNDDGKSWEYYAEYTGSGITNVVNQPWHDFHTFGSKLRWKACCPPPTTRSPDSIKPPTKRRPWMRSGSSTSMSSAGNIRGLRPRPRPSSRERGGS
ncbi:MAG: VCBS repeat-containing protein [Candidatus Aminicenantes bacterium]|nr:VCBS repeat-containing protein [Candidatus Aminicenantes bacterium]